MSNFQLRKPDSSASTRTVESDMKKKKKKRNQTHVTVLTQFYH